MRARYPPDLYFAAPRPYWHWGRAQYAQLEHPRSVCDALQWARGAVPLRVKSRAQHEVRAKWRRAGFNNAKGCPRLPQASASLGQSASWAALAGHIVPAFHTGFVAAGASRS